MSFPNTHTPTLGEIEGKARYQCPMHKVRGVDAFYLTPELEQHFRRLFPKTINREMMRLFGISFSTMQRFKRQLGLEKKMPVIRRKQAAIAKQICEANGYYDSIRGKAPSEACQEASRQKRASGFHPMKALKRKNPRRYKRICQERSEKRKELCRKERLRVNWGMQQHTKLYLPYAPLGRKRSVFRNCCKQVGYIPGAGRDEQERWYIYYTAATCRSQIRELHGARLGFHFVPLPTENTEK